MAPLRALSQTWNPPRPDAYRGIGGTPQMIVPCRSAIAANAPGSNGSPDGAGTTASGAGSLGAAIAATLSGFPPLSARSLSEVRT
jgi:hypothetical protein